MKRKVGEFSLEYFKEIVEHSPDMIHSVDVSGQILYANETECSLLGYSRKSLLGKTLKDIYSPALYRQVMRGFKELRKTGKLHVPFGLVRRKDGTTFPVEIHSIGVYDSKHHFIRTRSILHDITERVAKEAHESEKDHYYKEIVENALVGVYRTTPDGHILYANQALARFFGMASADEMLNRNAGSFYKYPEDRQRFIVLLKKQRKVDDFEVVFVKKNGEEAHGLLSAILSPNGQLFGMIRDVTDRVLAEENYRILANNVGDLIFTAKFPSGFSLAGRLGRWVPFSVAKRFIQHLQFTYVTPSVQSVLGYTPQEFLKRSIFEIVPEFYMKALVSVFAEEILNEKKKGISPHRTRSIEMENIRKDGQRAWVESQISFVRDPKGVPIGFIGVSRDITKRKASEDMVRKFRLAFDRSEQIMFMADAQKNIIYANAAFEKAYGYKISEVLGQNPRFLKSGKQPPSFYKHFWHTLDVEKKPLLAEIINKTKDGRFLNIRTHMNPILDDRQTIVGYLALQTDITQQKQIEEALKFSEQRYRDIVEHSPEMIHSVDAKGRLLFANQRECNLLGYPLEKLLKMNISQIYAPELSKKVKTGFSVLKKTGKLFIPDGQMVTRTGESLDVEIDSMAIYDAEGKFVQTRSIIRDVRERKRSQQALARLNNALSVVKECNQLLVRTEKEKDLLDSVAEVMMTLGGYRLVWVGYLETDSQGRESILPRAFAGHDAGYLKSLTRIWKRNPHAKSAVQEALREQKALYIKETSTDPRMAACRKETLKHGYGSCIVLPLSGHQKTLGILAVYSPHPHAFDPHEIQLLTELAGDITFGIETIRDREILKKTSKDLADKVRQMEFMSRLNLRRYEKMIEQQKEIIQLRRSLGQEPPTLEEIHHLFSEMK